MDKYIWIGHRESEIFKTNDFFSKSITSWGSGLSGNISYNQTFNTRTIINELRNEFISDALQKLMKSSNYKVMFYSPALGYSLMKLYPEFKDSFICLNSKTILSLLNDKINTRLWISS